MSLQEHRISGKSELCQFRFGSIIYADQLCVVKKLFSPLKCRSIRRFYESYNFPKILSKMAFAPGDIETFTYDGFKQNLFQSNIKFGEGVPHDLHVLLESSKRKGLATLDLSWKTSCRDLFLAYQVVNNFLVDLSHEKIKR